MSLAMDESPRQSLILNLAADKGLTTEPGLIQVGKRVSVQVGFPSGHLPGGFQEQRGCRVEIQVLPGPACKPAAGQRKPHSTAANLPGFSPSQCKAWGLQVD